MKKIDQVLARHPWPWTWSEKYESILDSEFRVVIELRPSPMQYAMWRSILEFVEAHVKAKSEASKEGA